MLGESSRTERRCGGRSFRGRTRRAIAAARLFRGPSRSGRAAAADRTGPCQRTRSVGGRSPVVLAGALAIAFSGILVRLRRRLADDGRVLALRVGAARPLGARAAEERRYGPRSLRERRLAWCAGAFFAADLILWHNAIEQVGAGLATVLGNTQVVLVALLAWAALGERPPRAALAAIPVVSVGVVLISGVLEEGAYGANPALGALFGVLTGIAYSGFLLVLREGNRDDPAPGRAALRRDARVRARVCGLRHPDRRPRPDAVALGDGLADRARAQRAGLRLAADLGLAAAAAGGADLRDADVSAALLGRLRRAPARRGRRRTPSCSGPPASSPGS